MTASEKPKLGAILLAAGGSSRLGRSKQLLKFEGESLIRRAARSLADSVYYPVVIVLGAEYDRTLAEIEGAAVHHTLNKNWQEGMSSSIRAGLARSLEIGPNLDGVLIALCDQPRISSEMFNRFAARFSKTNADIVAAAYDGIVGVPALFSREIFDELRSLRADKGARQIIRDSNRVVEVELPEAAMDIDTPADAETFDCEILESR